MSMSKKDFIALAKRIKEYNEGFVGFGCEQVDIIADFCATQNPRFNRERWLSYIAGECGPSGGKVSKC